MPGFRSGWMRSGDSSERRDGSRSQKRMSGSLVPPHVGVLDRIEAPTRRAKQQVGGAVDPKYGTDSSYPAWNMSVSGNHRNRPISPQGDRRTERDSEDGTRLKFPVGEVRPFEGDTGTERQRCRCQSGRSPGGLGCEKIGGDGWDAESRESLDDAIDVRRPTPSFMEYENRSVTHG